MHRRHPSKELLGSNAATQVDDDDDDAEPLLTQPPSLVNTFRSPSSADEDERAPPSFLDSVRRAIDNESEYNVRNAIACTNPPTPPPFVIPDYISSAISHELKIKWGCDTPRQYQIEAIFQLVYTKIDMMYLIRKTGDGKSLVLQGTASILKGITIVMVPLIGLGSDQAQKCNIVRDNNICVESYHLDEFKNNNALELRERLHEYTREEKTAIIVFVSPQQLTKFSLWRPVLMSLAQRGCVSAVCVDEVHCTVHNYESF